MEEKDQLDERLEYKTTHAEMAKTAITQCEMGKHKFVKLSDNEVFCHVCQSAYIVENINDYL